MLAVKHPPAYYLERITMAVDATPGGESANSYVDEIEADEIAAQYGLTDFIALSAGAKENALKASTSIIDATPLKGTPLDADGVTQALFFPATGVPAHNGRSLDGTVPMAIKVATVLIADGLSNIDFSDISTKLDAISIDAISISFASSGNPGVIPDYAKVLVNRFAKSTFTVERG